MGKFNIGDKVFSKKGWAGEEIGTVQDLGKSTVVVRLFSDPSKVSGTDFNEAELLTEAEHRDLVAQDQARQERENEEMQDKWKIGR